MVFVAVTVPAKVALPVVVIVSIYASFQYLVVVPKSCELSASGIRSAESCTNVVLPLPPPKYIELPSAVILSSFPAIITPPAKVAFCDASRVSATLLFVFIVKLALLVRFI